MALVVHSKKGLGDLTRHLQRLTLLSSNYATSTVSGGQSTLGSIFSSKAELFPSNVGVQSLLLGGVRYAFSRKPNVKEARRAYAEDDKNAIHCHGFSYYPRYPDHKDPPIEPTKLFMVKRIRSMYGTPHWEKKLVRKLNLENRRSVAILKNTPTVNEELYKIKHLIEITPITIPYGMPEAADKGFLKENGQLISYNPLKLHNEDATLEGEIALYQEHRDKTIQRKLLERRLHLRWYSRYDIVT